MNSSPKFQEALVFAAQLHAQQVRKGTSIPYISHLLAVASIAIEYGANEEEAIAALLHDAVEDQGGDATREEICKRFGDRVATIVDGCTDAKTIPKPPWKKRKERYLSHLRNASSSVKLVSAADKLHNARSITTDFRIDGNKVWERFNATREEQLWYYRGVIAALRHGWTHPLVSELIRVVNEMERLVKSEIGIAPK